MGSESPVVDREEIEATLCQIAEIEAARVVGNDNDLIQELHVLASGEKAPRQIVRDIESLLMARFGIAVDHKRISIAQISNGNGDQKRGQERLKITNINMHVQDKAATLEVKLEHHGKQYTGLAAGPPSQSGRLRLAALAALDAAGKCAADDTNFALEQVAIVPAGTGKVAVACISVIARAGEEMYSGSAVVKTNESDAVVKATLSAINRYLTQIH